MRNESSSMSETDLSLCFWKVTEKSSKNKNESPHISLSDEISPQIARQGKMNFLTSDKRFAAATENLPTSMPGWGAAVPQKVRYAVMRVGVEAWSVSVHL